MANPDSSIANALKKYQARIENQSDNGFGTENLENSFEQNMGKMNNVLININSGIKNVSNNILKTADIAAKYNKQGLGGILDKFGGISRMLSADLAKMTDPKRQGSFTKFAENLLGLFKKKDNVFANPMEALSAINSLMLNELKLITSVLQDGLYKIRDNTRDVYSEIHTMASMILFQMMTSKNLSQDILASMKSLAITDQSSGSVQSARELISSKETDNSGSIWKSFFTKFEGMFDVLFKDTKVESATKFMSSSYKFMENMGNAGKSFGGKWLSKIADWGWVVLMLSPLKKFKGLFSFLGKMPVIGKTLGLFSKLGNILRIVPMLARIAAIFGGISGFMGAIVGSVAFAVVWAAIKNPDQLAGYFDILKDFLGMFKDIFAFIGEKILPPLGIAAVGFGIAFLWLADYVGSFLNAILIPTFKGIVILLKGLGRMFMIVWDSMEETVMRVLGIFGVGKYGKDGFLENIKGIFLSVMKVPYKLLIAAIDTIMNLFNWGNWLDLKEGEGFIEKITKNFWGFLKNIGKFLLKLPVTIFKFFTEMGKSVAKWIWEGIKQIGNFILKYNIITIGSKLVMGIVDMVVNMFSTFTEWLKTPIDWIFTQISTIFDALTSWMPSMEDIGDWFFNMLPGWLKDLMVYTGQLSQEDVDFMEARIKRKEDERMKEAEKLSNSQTQNNVVIKNEYNVVTNNTSNSSTGYNVSSAPQTRRPMEQVGVLP